MIDFSPTADALVRLHPSLRSLKRPELVLRVAKLLRSVKSIVVSPGDWRELARRFPCDEESVPAPTTRIFGLTVRPDSFMPRDCAAFVSASGDVLGIIRLGLGEAPTVTPSSPEGRQ